MPQAMLELVARSRRTPFASHEHILNAMANYLHAAGAPGNYAQAIYAYNHAGWYVAEVLAWAHRYRAALAPTPPPTLGAPARPGVPAAPGSPAPGETLRLPAGSPWLASLPGTALRCDARIVPDVTYLLAQFGLRATSCYREDGPGDHGEHALGLALDAVPTDGDWSHALAAAHAFGWQAACGSTGCAGQLRPPMRFIGYNGYPGHGDPAHGGSTAHIHFSWLHAPAAPYTQAAWVEVFAPGAQAAVVP